MGRLFLGLDLRADALRAVALERRAGKMRLISGRTVALPVGALKVSAKSVNIEQPQPVSEALREVLDPLSGYERRIALSLPLATGAVVPLELDSPLGKPKEAIDLLRWQLKDVLPVESRQLQIDYRVVESRENGSCRVLTALMSREVLTSYEESLREAGYFPEKVSFHPLDLYGYYQPRHEMGGDFLLIAVEGGMISLQLFTGRTLFFQRCREGSFPDLSAVARELQRSLVACHEVFANLSRLPLYLHSDWENLSEMVGVVQELSGQAPIVLDPEISRMATTPLEISSFHSRVWVTAIGAAESLG
ncbi:MAG: hypothetical protein C0621_09900 [Desulfuromonas sp.]|nr:MAG: hypothetical protein C0621_09900 [Desulfuromonas sp.]